MSLGLRRLASWHSDRRRGCRPRNGGWPSWPELLEARGYASFREARHPFGLTQRQAAGKFTGAEIDELIDRLEADAGVDAPEEDIATSIVPADQRRQRARDEELVVGLDADVMATELVNRGWCCIPPPT